MFEFLEYVDNRYGLLALMATILSGVVCLMVILFLFLISIQASDGLSLTVPFLILGYFFYKWRKSNGH